MGMTEAGNSFTPGQVAFLASTEFGRVRGEFHDIIEKYADSFRIQTQLRKRFPALDPALIAAGASASALQRRAAGKTALPSAALFTAQSLEQASSAATARLHARLLADRVRVLEWCGGAGSDTLALSLLADHVTVLEADAVVAAFLRHNIEAAGRANIPVLEDRAEHHASALSLADFDSLFADPSRRSDGRRSIAGEHYSPPLSLCERAAASIPTMVKTAPALDLASAFWKRIFVAVGRECREQLLLRGIDAPGVSCIDAESGEQWIPGVAECAAPELPRYLLEPHAAIIRTGAVRSYLAEFNAVPVDPRIAYGLASAPPPASRWHARFEVLDALPFQRTRLQEAIRAHGFGPATEIKKRGFRLLPDEVRAMFRFDGDSPGVLVCTRIGDTHMAYLCKRME